MRLAFQILAIIVVSFVSFIIIHEGIHVIQQKMLGVRTEKVGCETSLNLLDFTCYVQASKEDIMTKYSSSEWNKIYPDMEIQANIGAFILTFLIVTVLIKSWHRKEREPETQEHESRQVLPKAFSLE